jgi:predicted MFS family arabinose efflux permease
VTQAISTGYVAATATEGRSSAVGLYVTVFYIGGSVGAALPGLLWSKGGWPAVIAMTVIMVSVMAAIVATVWRTLPKPVVPAGKD